MHENGPASLEREPVVLAPLDATAEAAAAAEMPIIHD